jgi:hypothetical protein
LITEPGKFEGCPEWAPYYWDLSLEGGHDSGEEDTDGVFVVAFSVTAEDVGRFPELDGLDEIRLWEDDQGFVHTETTP